MNTVVTKTLANPNRVTAAKLEAARLAQTLSTSSRYTVGSSPAENRTPLEG